MSGKSTFKESFVIEQKHGAFYTGGDIAWSNDGELIFCQTNNAVNVVDVSSGVVRTSLGSSNIDENADSVLCFTTDRTGERVITAHRSGLFGLWNVAAGTRDKCWKSVHRGPISSLALHSMDDILASGGTDGLVRIWDLVHYSCSAALRGASGVISILVFHELNGMKMVFGSADDLAIHCWDLETNEVCHSLTGHFSKVTGLTSDHSGEFLISCSRDKTVMLWNLTSWTCAKTIPLYEGLESIVILPRKISLPVGQVNSGIHVVVAGESGVLRVVEMKSGKVVYSHQECSSSVSGLMYNEQRNCLAVVTVDHNIALVKLDDFGCTKQLVGFSQEILDLVLVGSQDSHLAVATNSKDILLYNMKHNGCQLLRGHSDLVLSLAVAPANRRILLSASKDCSVKIWELDVEQDRMLCVGTGNRHTASVSCISFFELSADTFLSGSLDTTLKLWSRKGDSLTVRRTEVAHSKDINNVTVSPNDKLAATASQDKTIKLWDTNDLSLLGVLSGHRRGVWSVRFSPVDQVILSTSADCTLKLWSVTDLSCLKTLQGHESSVMSAEFLSRGMQIVSVSGDGLVKLWTIKSGECIGTYDGHDGKIWALAVSEDEDKLITGGGDSQWIVWRDDTEEKRQAAIQERETKLLMEQKLNNLLHSDRLLEALAFALDLDMPFKVLNILKDLQKQDDALLLTTVGQLNDEQKQKLLRCASTWNCNAKHCIAAQLVTSALLKNVASQTLPMPALSKYVEEMLPYTERHFKRLTSTLQSLHLLQFTIRQMNPALDSG